MRTLEEESAAKDNMITWYRNEIDALVDENKR
jgi:hypothetical protein